jgi:hypothetical protein
MIIMSNINSEDYRYFIRVRGEEIGWVYFYKKGEFENDTHITLRNELIPGEIIESAHKSDFKEISKEQYNKIIEFSSINPADIIEETIKEVYDLEKLKAKLSQACKDLAEVSELWRNLSEGYFNKISEAYPFNEDFEEIIQKMWEWKKNLD